MRTKKCKRCGKIYDTDKQGGYLCPECAAEYRRRKQREADKRRAKA